MYVILCRAMFCYWHAEIILNKLQFLKRRTVRSIYVSSSLVGLCWKRYTMVICDPCSWLFIAWYSLYSWCVYRCMVLKFFTILYFRRFCCIALCVWHLVMISSLCSWRLLDSFIQSALLSTSFLQYLSVNMTKNWSIVSLSIPWN